MDILENNPRKRTIALARRTTIAIIAIAACAVLVGATVVSNFVIPSKVTVTSAPGITAYESDGTTIIGQITFGDIQQGSVAQTHQVIIKNTGGQINQYLLDNAGGQITGVPSSLTFSGVPSSVTPTWNFASVYSSPIGCGSVNYPCALLGPTQASQLLTLSISATAAATPGAYSFTITFQAFSTASG